MAMISASALSLPHTSWHAKGAPASASRTWQTHSAQFIFHRPSLVPDPYCPLGLSWPRMPADQTFHCRHPATSAGAPANELLSNTRKGPQPHQHGPAKARGGSVGSAVTYRPRSRVLDHHRGGASRNHAKYEKLTRTLCHGPQVRESGLDCNAAPRGPRPCPCISGMDSGLLISRASCAWQWLQMSPFPPLLSQGCQA